MQLRSSKAPRRWLLGLRAQHRHVRSELWARKMLSAEQCAGTVLVDVRVLLEGSSLGVCSRTAPRCGNEASETLCGDGWSTCGSTAQQVLHSGAESAFVWLRDEQRVVVSGRVGA